MKALSLWEPWATAIALNIKCFETRSWATTYRGPLLICAATKRLPFIEIAHLLMLARITQNDLWYGRAVCIVDLVDIFRTEIMTAQISNIEKKFGDYSPGRFAWKFEKVRRFIKPPLVRGKQGLFYAPDWYQNLETYDPILFESLYKQKT